MTADNVACLCKNWIVKLKLKFHFTSDLLVSVRLRAVIVNLIHMHI